MIELTYDSTLKGLNNLVALHGEDFIYQRHVGAAAECAYVHEGNPDCIVGKLLHSLGVSIEQLAEFDELRNSSAGEVLDILIQQGVITADEKAHALLRFVQSYQDSQEPWGKAVRLAVDLVGDRYSRELMNDQF